MKNDPFKQYHDENLVETFNGRDFAFDCWSDCRMCKEALEHWNLSELKDAPIRSRKYRSFLNELEAEIMQNVKEFKTAVNKTL